MIGDRTQQTENSEQSERSRRRRLVQPVLLAGAALLLVLVYRLRRRNESRLEPPF